MPALAYFLAGAAFDFILTLYYLAVDKRQPTTAAVLSAALTVMSQCVIVNIMGQGRRRKYALIAAYALGNGVGTALAMMI